MSVINEQNHEGIVTLTLTRPDKLNALNQTVLAELTKILSRLNTDAQCHGVIITGEGKAFCAGADISELAPLTATSGRAFADTGQHVFMQLAQLSKPSIAAVNGVAFGGGCELAMAATLRIAASHAKFAQPEVKLGVIPGFAGTQRLSRLVGVGRATELCLRGDAIDAETAMQWGLVNAVVAAEELLPQADAWLRAICANGPAAVTACRDVIQQGIDMPFAAAQQLEAQAFAKLCESAEKAEGVDAFLNKRAANFRNL